MTASLGSPRQCATERRMLAGSHCLEITSAMACAKGSACPGGTRRPLWSPIGSGVPPLARRHHRHTRRQCLDHDVRRSLAQAGRAEGNPGPGTAPPVIVISQAKVGAAFRPRRAACSSKRFAFRPVADDGVEVASPDAASLPSASRRKSPFSLDKRAGVTGTFRSGSGHTALEAGSGHPDETVPGRCR